MHCKRLPCVAVFKSPVTARELFCCCFGACCFCLCCCCVVVVFWDQDFIKMLLVLLMVCNLAAELRVPVKFQTKSSTEGDKVSALVLIWPPSDAPGGGACVLQPASRRRSSRYGHVRH